VDLNQGTNKIATGNKRMGIQVMSRVTDKVKILTTETKEIIVHEKRSFTASVED
jgi:hypothetical protein